MVCVCVCISFYYSTLILPRIFFLLFPILFLWWFTILTVKCNVPLAIYPVHLNIWFVFWDHSPFSPFPSHLNHIRRFFLCSIRWQMSNMSVDESVRFSHSLIRKICSILLYVWIKKPYLPMSTSLLLVNFV